MEFPISYSTFTVPTGAGKGQTRIVLRPDGALISYHYAPGSIVGGYSALFNGSVYLGEAHADQSPEADFALAAIMSFQSAFPGPTPPAQPGALSLLSPVDATYNNKTAILVSPGTSDLSRVPEIQVQSLAVQDQVHLTVFGVSRGEYQESFSNIGNNANRGQASVSEYLAKTNADGTVNTPRIAPSLASGWATAASTGAYQPVMYWLDAEDNLIITGVLHQTSASPAGNAFVLPAGYIPPKANRTEVNSFSSSNAMLGPASMTVNSNGNVAFNSASANANGNNFAINVVIPLFNVT